MLSSQSREFHMFFCSINCYNFNTCMVFANIFSRNAKFSRKYFSQNFTSFTVFRFINFRKKSEIQTKIFRKMFHSLETDFLLMQSCISSIKARDIPLTTTSFVKINEHCENDSLKSSADNTLPNLRQTGLGLK